MYEEFKDITTLSKSIRQAYDVGRSLQPKKKVIDLFKVDSKLDMEFSNDGKEWLIGKLDSIAFTNNASTYSSGYMGEIFDKCRVRQNYKVMHVITKITESSPIKSEILGLPEGLKIIPYFLEAIVGTLLIGYEVVGSLDNYKYEWEKE